MQAEQQEEIAAEIGRQRVELNFGLLRIYNFYRIFVGLVIILIHEQDLFDTRLGSLDTQLFWIVVLAYTLLNFAAPLGLRRLTVAWPKHDQLNLGIVSLDILALTLLMYSSGGITSGIAPLILITVATGAILVTGRMATFVAATASIALLYEELYLGLSTAYPQADFFQAGTFGVIYFITSFAIQQLSNHIRNNEIRTLEQASELLYLERLNRQIIQRMRTGIIVVDPDNQVRMLNQSARSFIGAEMNQPLLELPLPVLHALQRWRADRGLRTPPLKVHDHTPEIRVNFSTARTTDATSDVTIFIEDTSEIQQHAQQLKLAELGRLSASIAHEVRNPLGAISHAAQLLKESNTMRAADQRLTEIIITHCQRMNDVVENVLEMSRRQHPVSLVINLADNVRSFLAQCHESFPDAQIETEIEPESTHIRFDQAHLNQALTNLMDNALRYSDLNGQGQRARIEGGVDQGSERPYLNVIDFGTGVPDIELSNLFRPFSTTTKTGTGLGLYITKELCNANKAQISYSRDPGGGARFRILFAHPDRLSHQDNVSHS
ncbi:MAG: HAMP domain-containing sensor histidine kinase [Pseudomonadota bacterium]|nr:HAMP domain-containing sensor histidine kinase [Pseudomonadota bacterium]